MIFLVFRSEFSSPEVVFFLGRFPGRSFRVVSFRHSLLLVSSFVALEPLVMVLGHFTPFFFSKVVGLKPPFGRDVPMSSVRVPWTFHPMTFGFCGVRMLTTCRPGRFGQ